MENVYFSKFEYWVLSETSEAEKKRRLKLDGQSNPLQRLGWNSKMPKSFFV